MYSHILHNLFMCSITGSIMLLLSMAARIFFKSRSADYHMMLLTAAAMFIFPVSSLFEIPKTVTVEIPQNSPVQAVIYGGTSEIVGGIGLSGLIFIIWSAVAVLMIAKNAACYIRFTSEIRRCREIDDERINEVYSRAANRIGVKRKVKLKSSEALRSPILFGIIRPVLVLPEHVFSERELEMIITHELIHHRHGDIVVKLMAVIAVCVQWFNPAVYVLSRKIGESCELWCDETVLRVLGINDKKEYGRLLLSVMENVVTGAAQYSTSMAASKRQIKKRLKKVVQYREATRIAKAAGMVMVIALSVCSVTAFGFSKAADAVPEAISEVFETPDIKPKKTEEADITPVETNAPEVSPEPSIEPSPEPETEQNEAAAEHTEEVVQNEIEVTAEITPEPVTEQAKSYTFTVEEESTYPPAEESGLQLTKGAGYILDVPKGNSYSAVMTAAENIRLVISRDGGNSITLIHNGRAAESNSFSIEALEGDTYEIRADMPEGGKIYINCR